MVNGSRLPNNRLRALLAEARWTGGDLARAVNAVAAEADLQLGYGRASVAQWLAGGQPRPPVPELTTEALSRALGRRLSLAEAGFSGVKPSTGTDPGGDGTVGTELADLSGIIGSTRRDALRYSIYSLSALIVPSMNDSAALPDAASAARPFLSIGKMEVEAAAETVKMFSVLDETLGAGVARVPLADYLGSKIAPWLQARTTAAVHQKILSVATELSYLCGFMCFDDELHGAAQRYYKIALRLSTEASDAIAYAITLRSMSAQARVLGHYRQASQLAETAIETAAAKAPPGTRAFLFGQLAVSAAAEGDRHRAVSSLLTAERELESMTSTSSSAVGAYHHGSLAHQQAAMLACLDDKPAAIAALQESIRQRPASEHRSRAITQARLAELQFSCGRVEEAVDTWSQFLDSYSLVRSGRARTAMANLRARLRPHRKTSSVESLLSRARILHSLNHR
ncbi:hypothetical protein BS330_03570 [Amycolatopsis keratiniphila subsp. nogabecina]|nr:hypothetical protein BS330_03570 [Amycolatopsis keratiniphila subsp. nogabecina]SDU66238.1 hypothetical protein SAMN04489733_7902 [Amycolatopsis keratiniphila]